MTTIYFSIMTVAAFVVAPYGSAIIPPAFSTPRKRTTRSWVVPVDSILEDCHRVATASASISGQLPHPATICTPDISSDVSSFMVATTATSSTTTFEPIVPDSTALLGFGFIVVLCAVAAWVWANQVVPVARTNLARSKRNGPVREYLDELRLASSSSSSSSRGEEYCSNEDDKTVMDISSNATLASAPETTNTSTTTTARTTQRDRSLERWLFTDWLETKAPSSKPSALPVLKNAKWNSGDNPVLAATALILLGVFGTAVTERIATTISL